MLLLLQHILTPNSSYIRHSQLVTLGQDPLVSLFDAQGTP